MRIVVMTCLERASAEAFLHDRVIYRPDLAARPAEAAADELARLRPDVLIARDTQLEPLASILAAMQGHRCRAIVCGSMSHRTERTRELPDGCSMVTAPTWQEAEHEAFVLAESICRPPAAANSGACSSARDGVAVIGAGVVSLMTALVLSERGHAVTVYDRMSDPLQADGVPANAGASFGGKDARIFSFNESRHHLASSSVGQFRRNIAQDGWLSSPLHQLTEHDRRWIRRLETLPPWAAQQYGNDILRFNRDSDGAWRRIFSLYPELLIDAHHVGRLLRVYPSEEALAHARAAEAEIGALIAPQDCSALLDQEPALVHAVANGAVAGALKVRGFSISIQRFCRNLVRLLQRFGVSFHWQHALEEVRYDTHGDVHRIVMNGRALPVCDAVICPGSHGHGIRSHLAGLADVGAMVGAWVTLPNDGVPLTSPLKVRRRDFGSKEAAQGANVIPARDAEGRPVLHCSSGHGFVGLSPEGVHAADLGELRRCVMQTAEDLFPDKFGRARAMGWLDGPPAYCVRPWTSSGLGVLEVQRSASGGRLVFSGGHNTGGFAQSPAVAEAVAHALEGRAHPMHTLYHPRRLVDVFGEAA